MPRAEEGPAKAAKPKKPLDLLKRPIRSDGRKTASASVRPGHPVWTPGQARGDRNIATLRQISSVRRVERAISGGMRRWEL